VSVLSIRHVLLRRTFEKTRVKQIQDSDTKMSPRIPIQVLVYPVRFREDSWEYLLLKRVEDRGGFWQGVTGAPEKKEKIPEAAKRELLEETGFIPEIIFKIDYSYAIDAKDAKGSVYSPDVETIPVHVFFARVHDSGSPVLDPTEHTECKWCTFEEAIDLLYWKEDKEVLGLVQAIIK